MKPNNRITSNPTRKNSPGKSSRQWFAALLLLTGMSFTFAAEADCIVPLAGLIGWWTGDGSAMNYFGTNNGTLVGGATATAAGFVAQTFTFNGTNQYVQIPDSPALRPANLTIETWVRFDGLDSPSLGGSAAGDQYIVFKQNTRNGDFEGFDLSKTRTASGDVFRFLVSSATAQLAQVNSTTLMSTGVWYHVAAVRGSNFLQIYVNGQLQGQAAVTFPQDYGALPLYFGTSGQSFWDHKFKGALDEVSLYNRALSSNEIAAVYVAGASGKCKTAGGLGIASQPQSQTVGAGSNVNFTVTAAGAAPFSYQWQFNGATIADATNTSLALTSVQPGAAGNYTVVVTNATGAITSSVATLTVLSPPAISTQPSSLTNIAGTTASFNTTATGSAPLSYRWRLNGLAVTDNARISGATSNVLTLSPVQAGDAGNYSLIVTNAAGSVTSIVATLTVNGPPVLTTTPTNLTIVAGATANFFSAATGTPPLSFQWRYNGTDIPAATNPSLSLANAQSGNAGNYTVVVANPVASITSAVATLTVLLPPAMTAQPQSQTNIAGTTVSFSAAAAGSAPLTYRWLLNGNTVNNSTRITGATTGTLTISNVLTSDAGNYQMIVTNAAGTTNSAVAVLTVIAPPTIAGQPTSQSVTAGSNASFFVSASGTAPLSFQWRKNGGDIPGATSSVLSLVGVQTNDAGNYQLVVTNIAGAATSAVAVLTVNLPGGCIASPPGLIGWWPGEGAANDVAGGNNGSLQGGATASAVAKVGLGFTFDGTNQFVQIPDSTAVRPTNLTIETWVRFDSLDSPALGGSAAGDQYLVFKQNSSSSDFEGYDLSKTRTAGGDVFRFIVAAPPGQLAVIRSTTPLSAGVWYHVAAVRGSNFIQLFVNGQLQGQTTVSFAQNYGTQPLYFGTSGQSFWDHKLKGALDEVSLYNRALSTAEIAAIYAAGANGKCQAAIAPTIVTQPTNKVFVLNGSATFAVTAVGTAPLNYQWYRDGFPVVNNARLSGATNAALVITGLQTNDIGNYQVVVTNSVGSASSAVVSLNTGIPPANDNFAAAVSIGGSSGSVSGNSANATKQSGEPNHAGNAGGVSVWYNWTAPSASPVTFDTVLSAFDTLLGVYTGTAVNGLTAVASNNNISTNNSRSRVTFTPVAGTVYRIAVDGANGANGNLTLRWIQSSVALPDLIILGSAVNPRIVTETFSTGSCAAQEGLVVPGTRRLIRFDTQTVNQGNADLFFGNPANNPLFVYAPCHAHYHFQNYMSYRLRNAAGNIAATGLKVGFCVLDVFRYSGGSAPNALYSCVNQGIQQGWGDLYDSTLDGQWIDITGLPDGSYTMEMEANPVGIIQESNYGNNITLVPITIGSSSSPPANNNFASAQTLLGTSPSVSGLNANATKETGEPNHAGNAGGKSVWYQWTAPATKSVTIDTIGSSFNTLLAVYTGSAVGSLSLVASNDDIIPGSQLQSRVTFNATADTVYRIAVDGLNGATGNIILTANQTVANDSFAACIFIGGVLGSISGSDVGATKETNEPNHGGNSGGHSTWYCWTAPVGGTVTFDTVGSTFNTLLGVYTGTSVGALTPVANNDDIDATTNLQSRVSFNAVGLTMYHIAVDGFNGDSGNTTLNWNFSVVGPASLASLTANSGPVMAPGSGQAVLSFNLQPEGMFQLAISGRPQQRYRVERSCDLQNWSPLATTIADFTGQAWFTDKAARHLQTGSGDSLCGPGQILGVAVSATEARFYRAVEVP